jgi:hypothetical protein
MRIAPSLLAEWDVLFQLLLRVVRPMATLVSNSDRRVRMPTLAGEVKLISNVTIVLRGPDGKIKEERVANTVTSSGKNGCADQLLASPTIAKPGWMAVGTGTPAATLLGAEIDRNALTSKTRSTNVVTFIGDWAAGDATGALTEAGVFNVATSNTVDMYVSASFSVVNKGAGDTLQISWTLTFP